MMNFGFASNLTCSVCSKQFPIEVDFYQCPLCSANLNVKYNNEEIKKHLIDVGLSPISSMFRYLPFLPLIQDNLIIPNVPVGCTPLIEFPHLATELGIGQLFIKDESRNPTASLKDRASALVCALVNHHCPEKIITTASTGNAGAALACMSAAMHQKAIIFVPKTAPPAKIAQLQIFSPKDWKCCISVNGNYDDAFRLCEAATKKYGWYCRNTGFNPFTAEGKKTVSFEICEQLANKYRRIGNDLLPQFESPDAIFVSVGDGNIISGVWKGICNLYDTGMILTKPRLFGIQSTKSNVISECWGRDIDPHTVEPGSATSIADSINADLPRDRVNALQSVKESNGQFIQVDDSSILEAIKKLGSVGIFVEPAAACAYAGLLIACQDALLSPLSRVVVIATGSGLKDIKAASQIAGPVDEIANLDDLEKILQ